jgi:hypothetical protein
MTPHQDADKETGRLEAFSDGVFAVAITLLVLDVKTPKAADLAAGHSSLTDSLLTQWPALVYSGAFICIGVFFNLMWIYASLPGPSAGSGIRPDSGKAMTTGYLFGPAVYIATFLLA